MSNLNDPFILQGLEAVSRYHKFVVNPDPRMGGFTDKAKSRFRYDVLRAWITLRRIADHFTGSDPYSTAFKFIDLYARRMPANPKDKSEFAAHGFDPLYDFFTVQTDPEDGEWDVDEKTGVLLAAMSFKCVSRKPPRLGGEPGGLPTASEEVRALYKRLKEPTQAKQRAGSPGRRDKKQMAARVAELRPHTPWKNVYDMINAEFGTTYEYSRSGSLQKLFGEMQKIRI